MLVQQNVWYAAALPGQIGSTLLRRIIVGKSILLFRRASGELAALADRCPHRFAPLSLGNRLGDVIQCKYHGLEFDASGTCVRNPHGKAISPHLKVHSYPVVERHGLIWIWPGNPGLAQTAPIPDLSHMDAGSGSRTVHSYLKTDYRHDILVDNLLDLSHADYLHNGSFSGGPARSTKVSVAERDHEVVIDTVLLDAPPPPLYASVAERVDLSFNTRWRPGNVMTFENWITPTGQPFEQGRRIRFAHIVTPETPGSAHYFMSVTRDHDLDSRELDEQLAARQVGVIRSEDGPMLQAIDAEMGGAELTDLHPVLLPVDAAPMRVRRLMERLAASEMENVTGAHHAAPAAG